MEYTILFEFYGRKMKTTVEASSSLNAMEKIKDKIIFHKVEEEKHFMQEDKTLDDFMNMFGMKK